MALISYFPCNTGSGSSLTDTYGTNTLTRSGGNIGWHTGGHGSNAYAFDPLNGYPQEQSFSWGTTSGSPFSISCWVYMLNTNMGPLFRALGTALDAHFIRVNETHFDQPGWQSFSTGEWFHLALVISETSYTYYINGIIGDTNTYTGWASYNEIVLGAYADGFVFPAYINDIYFFNEALTQSDVVKTMNNTYIIPEIDITTKPVIIIQ